MKEANYARGGFINVTRYISVTTLLIAFLYIVGIYYWTGFYSYFNISLMLLNVPFHEVIRPSMEMIEFLAFIAIFFVMFRQDDEAGEAEPSTGPGKLLRGLAKLSLVKWIIAGLVLFCVGISVYNVVINEAFTNIVGVGIAFACVYISDTGALYKRLFCLLVVLVVVCGVAQTKGFEKATETRSLPRINYTTRADGETPRNGILVAFDQANYFILDYVEQSNAKAKRRIRIIGSGEMESVEYVFD